jgi:GABA(A) receptor-associated protein
MKYPERIPIICEKTNSPSNSVPDLDKSKYLVPCDLTLGQFMFVIRNRMKLPSENALFLFVKGSIPSSNTIISELYDSKKDEDGFLYINYSGENTFGALFNIIKN